jgi:Toastrack DUF4097
MKEKKRNTTVWIVVAVIAVILCCAGILVVVAAAGWFAVASSTVLQITSTEQQRMLVTQPTLLEVHNSVGDVIVVPGAEGEVIVGVTKKVIGPNQAARERLMAELNVEVTQQGDRIVVTVSQPPRIGIGASASVDLEIRTPSNTSLEVETGVGNVEVRRLTGDFQVSSSVGDVILTDVTPQDRLEVRSSTGGVRFRGTLPASGQPTFESSVGDVKLELPADASFYLDAKTDVGSIDCEFQISSQQQREKAIGDELLGTVGTAPQATLFVRASTGSISIKIQ